LILSCESVAIAGGKPSRRSSQRRRDKSRKLPLSDRDGEAFDDGCQGIDNVTLGAASMFKSPAGIARCAQFPVLVWFRLAKVQFRTNIGQEVSRQGARAMTGSKARVVRKQQ
jgi:hypothetical protein